MSGSLQKATPSGDLAVLQADMEAVATRPDAKQYSAAVNYLATVLGLTLPPRQVAAVVVGCCNAGLTGEEVMAACRVLASDPDFAEVLRYRRKDMAPVVPADVVAAHRRTLPQDYTVARKTYTAADRDRMLAAGVPADRFLVVTRDAHDAPVYGYFAPTNG